MPKETITTRVDDVGPLIAAARQAAAIWFNSQGSTFSESVGGSSQTIAHLGNGKEGVVFRIEDTVVKCFHPGTIEQDDVTRLKKLLPGLANWLPTPQWHRYDDFWMARYKYEETAPVNAIGRGEAVEFLAACLNANVVCANIKFSNFRRQMNGGLLFVDVGRDIRRLERSWFLNSCARMHLLVTQHLSDVALGQLAPTLHKSGAYHELPGFDDFICEIMARTTEQYLEASQPWPGNHCLPPLPVTLLIKACAMDAHFLREQVQHIVGRLETPRRFEHRILLIDPKPDNFLREHHPGDLAKLLNDAKELCEDGWIDEVLTAPLDGEESAACNRRWFDLPTSHAHTTEGVPVTPQLWGFECAPTRWLLQCDIDVLVGRRDTHHDFISDMLTAASEPDVVGVAFNIPWNPEAGFRPYFAPPGEFVPEVRCGLLDLHAMEKLKPLPNTLVDSRLDLTWYRSVEQAQREGGLRTLRGGDSRSYYIHPLNDEKSRPSLLATVRDHIGCSEPPREQWKGWDLDATLDWSREERCEDLVFYLSGHNSPRSRLERCAAGLMAQTDQSFGLVVVDNASTNRASGDIEEIFRFFRPRLTIVRCRRQHDRARNILDVVNRICTRPNSVVAICDLDDVLIRDDISATLLDMRQHGLDLVSMPSFRPCKPFQLEKPRHDKALKSEAGGDQMPLIAVRSRSLHQLSCEYTEDCEPAMPTIMRSLVEHAQEPKLVEGYWMLRDPSAFVTVTTHK